VYPVRYEADFELEQSRAITFFRLILILPWYIVASIYGLAAFVVAVIAWFAIMFTGRYPQGLYNFNAGVLRFGGRFSAFTFLQTDKWPSFGFEQDPTYPVRVEVDPPLEKYNRWKTFFRGIVGIPVLFMLYLIPYIAWLAATVAWFHIVFMGRTSGGIHNALTVGIAYQERASAYFLLMTETLPPVSDQAPAPNMAAPAAAVTTATAKTKA
jgi:hypothetical protein